MDGWCSKEKALNFFDLVIQVNPQVCVEIGVFAGKSVYPVACALKYLGQGTVIGIDPWDNYECIRYYDPIEDHANLHWWNSVDMEKIHYSYINMINRYRLQNYCQTLRTTSTKAIEEINFIDILYIDGNHDEKASFIDVSLYLPKVRSGGYIWLNDSLWGSIQPAVDLLCEHCDVVKLIDDGNCILFKKR